VSQSEYDDAISAEQVARAEVQAARARLTEARLDLGYTHVEAPITGLSGRAVKSEGSLVSGTEATLLTTIAQVDPIYVMFAMPDGDLLNLNREAEVGRINLPEGGRFQVALRLSDGGAYEQTGKVDFSDHHIDPTTGTVEVRAELPNPNVALRPGQFVRVILSGAEHPNAILVPQRAIQEGPSGKFAYVSTLSQGRGAAGQGGRLGGRELVIHEGPQSGRSGDRGRGAEGAAGRAGSGGCAVIRQPLTGPGSGDDRGGARRRLAPVSVEAWQDRHVFRYFINRPIVAAVISSSP
jgi:membrane fusion protein (multidrug efflux system)